MWYDAIVICILLFATIRGAMKGLVWQLAVIASLVFCFVFAGSMSLALAPYIGVEPPLNRWIAMFALYAIFSFVAFGAARLIREWLDAVKFTEYDRHLGAVFGFVKGAVFALFVTFFTVTLSANFREHALHSQSGRAAAIVMDRLHPVMPVELHDVLEPYIHQLDQPGLNLQHTHDHPGEHGDHNHDHSESPSSGDPFSGVSDPFASGSTGEDLASWFAKLPPIFEDDVQSMVRKAFKNTRPSDRAELLEKLRTAVPSLMRVIADEWQQGKPTGRQSDTRQQEQMLKEIADHYQLDFETRGLLLSEVSKSLEGLPDGVVNAVVHDWHSDVLGLRPDPDTATNASTRLDARIARQVAIAGVPLNTLSSSLQGRLRDSQVR